MFHARKTCWPFFKNAFIAFFFLSDEVQHFSSLELESCKTIFFSFFALAKKYWLFALMILSTLQCGVYTVKYFDGTFTAFRLCQSGYIAWNQRRYHHIESIYQCFGFWCCFGHHFSIDAFVLFKRLEESHQNQVCKTTEEGPTIIVCIWKYICNLVLDNIRNYLPTLHKDLWPNISLKLNTCHKLLSKL